MRFTRTCSWCAWMLLAGLQVNCVSAANSREFARWFSPSLRQVEQRRDELQRKLSTLPAPPVEQQSEQLGYHSRFIDRSNQPTWITVDLGQVEAFDSVVLVPCDVAYGGYAGPGYGFPARFTVESASDPEFATQTMLADYSQADFPNPQDLPVLIHAPGASGRYVRVTATKLWWRGDSYLFALGELMVFRGNRNIAVGAAAADNSRYENPPTWRTQNATDGQSVLGAPIIIQRTPGNGYHSIENSKIQDRVGWVQVDLGKPYELEEVRLFPARPSDFPARRGFGFPLRFRIEASDEPGFKQPILITDETDEDFLNPAENPVSFLTRDVSARFVRVTATRWWHRNRDYVFALAEMSVYSGDRNVALHCPVEADTNVVYTTWRNEQLVDGFTSQGRIVEWPGWLRGLSERREALQQLTALNAERERLVASVMFQVGGWAAALLLIAALSFLLAVYRLRLRRHREVDLLRARIASDLHDEIGSNLGSIALLSRLHEDAPRPAQQTFQEIHRTAAQTLESMREIVWLIHPGHDGLDELAERLREFSRNMLAGVECTFEGPKDIQSTRLSLETRRSVYLMFKELLHNIVKHARATHVRIALDEKEDFFVLTVADNGVGFDPDCPGRGHGLPGLRERAQKLGGNLLLKTKPGAGTEVRLSVRIC